MTRDTIDQLQEDWNEQRPDLDPEPMGVVLRIQALARILGEQAAVRLQEFELQWWQYDVLSALRRQGAPYRMAASELADSAFLTTGAMTNRIDRLEDLGLVRRRNDARDGRKVLVELTPRGLRLIDDAAEARFGVAMDALDTLDAGQRETLSNLLRLVLTAHEPR